MARSAELGTTLPSRLSKRPIDSNGSQQSFRRRSSAGKTVSAHPADLTQLNGKNDPQIPPINKNPETAPEDGSCPFLSMADELIRDILDILESDPEKGVNIDRRAYLSQESFKPPPKPSLTRAQDLGNLRRTCRRLSELGAIHQFARVTTRFSHKEFQRLEWIAKQPHLTWRVKKFSYMVPYFYVEGRDRVRDILPSLPASLGTLDVQVYLTKIKEQKRIVESKEDQRALKQALSAFSRLQHVQILPVQDHQDSMLLSHIRRNGHLAQFVELDWMPACSHSTKTVSEALIASHSPCTRFSSPHLNPQSAMSLAQPGGLASLASQLTCLELHIDDGSEELDQRMIELSPFLLTVFQAATQLEAVHVGFPMHRPVTLPLEDVFHRVSWKSLAYFGIQGWKLNGEEIKDMFTRYRVTLRGLRLRGVLLKEGSMWRDVLQHVRTAETKLDWISLNRIGYATQFDEQWASVGAEIPDDPPGGYSSDSSDDFDDVQADQQSNGDDPAPDASNNGAFNIGGGHLGNTNGGITHAGPSNTVPAHPGSYDSDEESLITDSTHPDISDDEHGMAANLMEFPTRVAPTASHVATDSAPSQRPCTCGGREPFPDEADEFGDNGEFVPRLTRKAWEKWVVKHCPIHGFPPDKQKKPK